MHAVDEVAIQVARRAIAPMSVCHVPAGTDGCVRESWVSCGVLLILWGCEACLEWVQRPP